MGKNAKAGKRNQKQKVMRKMNEEARQISADLEMRFAKRMLPVAVTEAFIILLNLCCIVLHDDHGFGKKRLGDFVEHVFDTWNCIPEYVTLDELCDEVIRMTGCRLALTQEESETLKEFGLKGLVEEVRLNDLQRAWLENKRGTGWKSRTNRYGKEIV